LPKLKTPRKLYLFLQIYNTSNNNNDNETEYKEFPGNKGRELELAPLTILLGGNNSGKSTILEALFLAPNPFRSVPYVIGGYKSIIEKW